MSDVIHQCPKCGGGMDKGFLVDHTDYASARVETWVEGGPTQSFWTGIKLGERKQLPVTTFRCGKCGYLESYALNAAD